jgi:hypothetical protein
VQVLHCDGAAGGRGPAGPHPRLAEPAVFRAPGARYHEAGRPRIHTHKNARARARAWPAPEKLAHHPPTCRPTRPFTHLPTLPFIHPPTHPPTFSPWRQRVWVQTRLQPLATNSTTPDLPRRARAQECSARQLRSHASRFVKHADMQVLNALAFLHSKHIWCDSDHRAVLGMTQVKGSGWQAYIDGWIKELMVRGMDSLVVGSLER